MPSLSFNAMFADRVERGEKLHSIRAPRKRPEQWLPGKTLHLFTAMRTRQCRRLGVGTITAVHDIEIDEDGITVDLGRFAADDWLDNFAKADGFDNWSEFVGFFRDLYGLPWRGSLIKWQLQTPVSPTPTGGQT